MVFLHTDAGTRRSAPSPILVMAGGGIRGGTTFGSSDKLGAYPDTDAVTPGDLAATLLWKLGLDPTREMIDLTGRPYKLADGRPLDALFG